MCTGSGICIVPVSSSSDSNFCVFTVALGHECIAFQLYCTNVCARLKVLLHIDELSLWTFRSGQLEMSQACALLNVSFNIWYYLELPVHCNELPFVIIIYVANVEPQRSSLFQYLLFCVAGDFAAIGLCKFERARGTCSFVFFVGGFRHRYLSVNIPRTRRVDKE
jgi:hypothetical protein